MRRRLADEPAATASYTRNRIHELFQLLDAIEPQAEEIDQRTADFAALVRPVSLSSGSGERAAGTSAGDL